MTINNRGLAGQPSLPYVDYRAYAGADVFLDFTFLDHTGVAATPKSFTYQIDDITNAQNMFPATTVVPGNYLFTLQIPGSVLQMTHTWQGSQICQISGNAVLPDNNSNVPFVTVIELVSIQTPNGA